MPRLRRRRTLRQGRCSARIAAARACEADRWLATNATDRRIARCSYRLIRSRRSRVTGRRTVAGDAGRRLLLSTRRGQPARLCKRVIPTRAANATGLVLALVHLPLLAIARGRPAGDPRVHESRTDLPATGGSEIRPRALGASLGLRRSSALCGATRGTEPEGRRRRRPVGEHPDRENARPASSGRCPHTQEACAYGVNAVGPASLAACAAEDASVR
jgi:hypothetical protein